MSDKPKEPEQNPGPEPRQPEATYLRILAGRIERLERRMDQLETGRAPASGSAPQPSPPVQQQHPRAPGHPAGKPSEPAKSAPPAGEGPKPPAPEPPKPPAPEPQPPQPLYHAAYTSTQSRAAPEQNAPPPAWLQQLSGKPDAAGRTEIFSEGWEVRLATRLLPVIGGVLLLIGAAIGATLIETEFAPAIRVALGYLCAAGLGIGGWYASRKTPVAGQAAIACGLALGYFTSFGAHFLPPMHVFPLGVSLAAMAAFAVTLVLLADRWRSQPMAGLGLLLGLVGALVSAPVAETFALVSLAGMALAAGCLFLRREWMVLTASAVALVYLAVLLLWNIAPVPREAGPVWAHLGALAGIYTIFTLAFARWGHRWIARERAAHKAVREGKLEEGSLWTLPWAGSFAVINSLSAVTLIVILLWNTEVFWPEVHWALFALAGAESLRILLPSLRGRWEPSFHVALAFVLVTCGLVNVFSGLTESAVLAGAALAAAIAASRAPVLRAIRPLGALAAAFAGASYFISGMDGDLPRAGDAFFAHAAALLPVLFLLTSALPWERLGRTEKHPPHVFLRAAEAASAPFRALMALALFIVYTDAIDHNLAGQAGLAGMTLLLAAGMAFAGARAWALPLLGSLAACFVWAGSIDPATTPYIVTVILLAGYLAPAALPYIITAATVVAVPLLILVAWRATPAGVPSVLMTIFGLLAASVLTWGTLFVFHEIDGWTGAIAWGLGLAVAAGTVWLHKRPPLPTLARENAAEVSYWSLGEAGNTQRGVSPGALSAALLALAGFAWAILGDTGTHYWSPLIVGATMLPLFLPAAAAYIPAAVAPFGPVLAVTAWGAGWLVWREAAHGAALLPAGLAAGLAVLAARKPLSALLLPATSVAGFIAAVGAAGPIMARDAIGDGPQAYMALAAALLLAAFLLLPIYWQKVPDSESAWEVLRTSQLFRMIGVVGVGLTLAVLGLSDLLIGPAVTPSWGVLGAVLLGVGLLLADRTLRYTALAVFAIAIGRIFFHDLVGLDALTRAVAFFAVGLLLVVGGIAYGLARRRLTGTETGEEEP